MASSEARYEESAERTSGSAVGFAVFAPVMMLLDVAVIWALSVYGRQEAATA